MSRRGPKRHRAKPVRPGRDQQLTGDHFAVQCAVCQTEADLDDALQQSHDLVIELAGAHRTSGVSWVKRQGAEGVLLLRELIADYHPADPDRQVLETCATKLTDEWPDGWLVVAMCSVDGPLTFRRAPDPTPPPSKPDPLVMWALRHRVCGHHCASANNPGQMESMHTALQALGYHAFDLVEVRDPADIEALLLESVRNAMCELCKLDPSRIHLPGAAAAFRAATPPLQIVIGGERR